MSKLHNGPCLTPKLKEIVSEENELRCNRKEGVVPQCVSCSYKTTQPL